MLANVTHQKATGRRRSKHASQTRTKAAKASETCSERMVRGHLRSHPPSKKNAQKRHCVIEAVIIKRNTRRHVYQVRYTSPITGKKEEKWLPVDDVTSLTLGEEKKKQRLAKVSKKRQKAHRKTHTSVKRTSRVGPCLS